MARQLLAEGSVNSTLDGIAEQAVYRIDGCEAASIMVLDRNRKLNTLAASNELGRESDQIQTE